MAKFTTIVQGLVIQGDIIVPWTGEVRAFVDLHGLSNTETVPLENAEILIHRGNTISRIPLRLAIISKGNLYGFEDDNQGGLMDLPPIGFK